MRDTTPMSNCRHGLAGSCAECDTTKTPLIEEVLVRVRANWQNEAGTIQYGRLVVITDARLLAEEVGRLRGEIARCVVAPISVHRIEKAERERDAAVEAARKALAWFALDHVERFTDPKHASHCDSLWKSSLDPTGRVMDPCNCPVPALRAVVEGTHTKEDSK